MLDLFNSTPFDAVAAIALIVTAVIIAGLIIVGIIIKRRSPQSIARFKNVSIGLAAGYSLGVLAPLLYLKIHEYAAMGYIDYSTFLPVIILIGIIIIFAITALIISIFRPEKTSLFARIALICVSIAFIVFFVAVSIINKTSFTVIENGLLLYIFTAAILAIIAILTAFICKKQDGDKTKSIVYAAVCIAMSFALSYLRLFQLPQGGSITFASLLPLMLYSFMYGGRKGVLAGLVYGMLQFIQSPWFMHPVQFLLDYPIAFAAIGLTGMLRERNIFHKSQVAQFCVGATAATVLRYLSHVISGIFVFGSGDPENYGAVAWSFLYNAFTFADLAIVLVVAVLLFASKTGRRLVNENSYINLNKIEN